MWLAMPVAGGRSRGEARAGVLGESEFGRVGEVSSANRWHGLLERIGRCFSPICAPHQRRPLRVLGADGGLQHVAFKVPGG
jgi:hypothetical protein